MYIVNTNEDLLKQRIAANLAYYRKMNNLTQAELGERISYSDKSVSKWERGEGVPDIYVFALLADQYGISVNDLLSENAPPPPVPDSLVNRQRFIMFLMSVGLAWLVATIAFTVLRLAVASYEQAWFVFILAIPASSIVAVVLTSLWWGMTARFLSVSALVWSVAACIYIAVPLHRIYLIFAVCGVVQVLVFLWFLMKKQARGL